MIIFPGLILPSDVALEDPDENMAPWTLGELMNGPIKEKLGIIPEGVTWGG